MARKEGGGCMLYLDYITIQYYTMSGSPDLRVQWEARGVITWAECWVWPSPSRLVEWVVRSKNDDLLLSWGVRPEREVLPTPSRPDLLGWSEDGADRGEGRQNCLNYKFQPVFSLSLSLFSDLLTLRWELCTQYCRHTERESGGDSR